MPRIFGYQIISSDVLKGPLTLLDNQSVPVNLITYSLASVNYVQLQYSLTRNDSTVSGRLLMIADADGDVSIQNDDITTNIVDLADNETAINLGIKFSASIQFGSLVVQYTSTANGFPAVMKWYEKSWI
jgi:hypothetical protein